MLLIPEPDQGVRAQSDAFPTDEQQQEIVGQHQGEHRGGEKVEECKKPPVRFVLMHVANRIHMNQPTDAGDNQDHDGGERVDPEGDVYLQGTNVNPRGEEGVQQEPMLWPKTKNLNECG
jgi:hypothetical protein